MSNEYSPGITELRLNVHSAIVGINKLAEDLTEIKKALSELQNKCSFLTEENIVLKEKVSKMQAKLYEAGIR